MKLITCTHDRHAASILDILNEAIVHSTAIYDYHPRTIDSMHAWFSAKDAGNFPVLGLETEEGELAGFAGYGVFRAFPAYKYSVEHSVYIHHDHRRKGLARSLMQALIAQARQQNLHCMIGAVDMNNAASIALHDALGFTHAGTIRQAGFKFGQWLDVGFYQLLLETPSHPVDG